MTLLRTDSQKLLLLHILADKLLLQTGNYAMRPHDTSNNNDDKYDGAGVRV